jgi:hypothetical protein
MYNEGTVGGEEKVEGWKEDWVNASRTSQRVREVLKTYSIRPRSKTSASTIFVTLLHYGHDERQRS